MSTWENLSLSFLVVLPIQVCEWSDACGNQKGLDYNHTVLYSVSVLTALNNVNITKSKFYVKESKGS